MMDRELNIFKHGAQWLRADFHLHTRADKKAFTDWDENVSFKKEFVQKLSEEGIKVGVITNHNKFDKEEYRSLAQKAKQEEILLLPGVELSVNEGASGVHACIVFDPGKWLENGEDYINRFLSQAFPDSTEDQRANNNAHSEWTLKELLEKLDDQYKKYKKDSFIVFAHVDNEKGIFNEIERTRLEGLIKNPLYKKFVLGYQKVRKRDRVQMLNEICEESDIPAFIEGCDAKKLEDIGKVSNDQNGNPVKSYLKLSAFSFEAIKLSLIQKEIRYARAENPPKSQNGRITSVRFETSNSRPLYEKSLHLNPDLNCLIGIRGSGKSSLFETLRYGLGKNLRDNSEDIEYKDRLIEYALGNRSGSVIIDFVDKYGKEYQIKRIHGQRIDLYKEGEKLPIFDIDENLLNILYFGQKDLSSIGKEGFSEALIEKFFGDNLSEKREDIENKKNNVFQILDKIKGTENLSQQLEEANQQIATIDEKLQIFKDHKIDDKLKGEAQHNQDLQELNNWIEHVRALKADIQNIVEQHQYTIGKELQLHNSSNEELFDEVKIQIDVLRDILNKLRGYTHKTHEVIQKLNQNKDTLSTRIESLKEEFAKIKRGIDPQDINPDDYKNLIKKRQLLNERIKELDRRQKERSNLLKQLDDALQNLQVSRKKEFEQLRINVNELNEKGLSIQLDLEFQGDKKAFKNYLKDIVQGSGIRENKLEELCQVYNDPINLFFDIRNKQSKVTEVLNDNQFLTFKDYIYKNLRAFLTFQVPNKYTLKYNGKDIKEHSLGQRASAVMLFLLARQENDIIMIDQPEDDIDNQSIYNDFIKELLKLKSKTQFIFVTHNPNIPVLGEAEQVFSCDFEQDTINVIAGGLDSKSIQTNIIEIMEGGKQAFETREKKYQSWID